MSGWVALHGRHVSLVLEKRPKGAPLWRHFGARLPDDFDPHDLDRTARAAPSFSPDHDCPFSIFPTFGLGWFGQSALLSHRSGLDFAQDVTASTITRLSAHAVRIVLTDDVARLDVSIDLHLSPDTDVLTTTTRLTNTGETALELHWLASGAIPLPSDARMVRAFGGRHNAEFGAIDHPLSDAIWRRENRRGLTSHEAFPGAVVIGTDGAWGAQLAWSGNHAQTIDRCDDGRYQWQLGEWLVPGEVRLARGETHEAPSLLATYSPEGPGGVARNFHAAIRARLVWPGGAMRPRPVHLNTWEALYFKHDVAELKSLADAAAQLGVERLVLDDGWFAGRHDDTSSLGDWTPDAVKYPDGLLPVAEHVTKLGMEFGLWVEPEMINPDSDLFRRHPDWAMQLAGRPLLTARNQLVLDLARPDVSDYIFAALSKLLNDLPIGYLKWDFNRAIAPGAGGDGRPAYRRHVLALYALIDRIRSIFPNVEIEACAGGGGRIDAGLAGRTHRFWTSDNIDSLSRLEIQRGFLQFMPPELMGAHVGASPAHATGRRQGLDFRAAVALPGHFGLELDPRLLGDEARAQIAQWISLYKRLREKLHTGGVWTGSVEDGRLWQAHGSEAEIVLFVYQIKPPKLPHPAPIKLSMLDRESRFTVTRVDSQQSDRTVPGAWLATVGLSDARPATESAAICHLKRAP